MKKVIFFFVLIVNTGSLLSQQTDSLQNIINNIVQMALADTTDLEDFFVDVEDDSSSNSEPNGYWDGKYCKKHYYEKAAGNIQLVNRKDPYIKIYEDNFNTLDVGMWKNPSNKIKSYFDHYVSKSQYGAKYVTQEEDNTNQALYLEKNIQSIDGSLVLKTLTENYSTLWSNHPVYGYNHYIYGDYYPDGTPVPKHTFKYTSARAQSAWGFDGSGEISEGEITDSEGAIVIFAKVKHPSQIGTYPSYWFMGFEEDGYSEFDVFEFMDNDFENLKTSHYNNSDGVKKDRCSTSTSISNLNTDDLYYVFIWNTQLIAAYVSNEPLPQAYHSNSMKKLFILHHIARNNRIGGFQDSLKNDEYYRRRQRFIIEPMKINFNTAVYANNTDNKPNPDNPDINTSLKVDYIKVYKQIKCPDNSSKILQNRSDLKIRNGVYNVMFADNFQVDFTGNTQDGIESTESLKLLSKNNVIIQKMSVANDAQFIIEHRDENAFCNSFSVPNDVNEYAQNNMQLGLAENLRIAAKWTLVDMLGRLILEGDSRELVFMQMQLLNVESTVYLLGSFDKSGNLIKYEKIFVRSN